MEAVQRFDPYQGVKLSSYAVYWIRAYILKYILDNMRSVRLGTTRASRKLFFRLNKEKRELERQGYEVEPRLLAERLDVSEDDVIDMEARLSRPDVSFDAPVRSDESDASEARSSSSAASSRRSRRSGRSDRSGRTRRSHARKSKNKKLEQEGQQQRLDEAERSRCADLRGRLQNEYGGSQLPAYATSADLEAELKERAFHGRLKTVRRYSRSAFMLGVNAIEYGNRRAGGVLALDGWSGHVDKHVVDDVEDALVELYGLFALRGARG